MLRISLAFALAVAAGGAALAHIAIEPREAPVGTSVKATFRVTHGCDGAATTGVRISMPEGFIGVKPMPKPGWTIETRKGPYKATYAHFHGRKLSEGVVEVTWSGGDLPNEFVDEFSVVGFMARELKAGETLTFPVVQDCAAAKKTEWVQTPKDENDHPARPAPQMTLTGGDAHAGH